MDSEVTARKQRLRRYLDHARQAALWKAENLDEAQLRRPMVPSGTNVLGVINHLAVMEFGYFSYCLKRPVDSPRAVQAFTSEDPMADFVVEADTGAADVLQFYRQAIDAASTAFEELELDAPASVPWWGEDSETTLEHLMLHMVEETSRHAGHLDLVRELIDGQTGLSAQNGNLPEFSDEQWKEHYARLKKIADSV
ncbi:DinB family protein [Glutamicibacter sp. V16R2B1]|uniref:DinB family protein n=1 Tax=Glutamicibacter sp. V16R2B1 TaxID=2036207 RepID=UPI0010FDA776|nr:DinB family protein [Glutamicibacter sp. V16R2B1]TLK54308.1 DinB family protein [Glutamicibacter sp. V16R2B1]